MNENTEKQTGLANKLRGKERNNGTRESELGGNTFGDKKIKQINSLFGLLIFKIWVK